MCFPLPNCSRRFNIMSGVTGSKWDALAFLKERWKFWHGRTENVFHPECCFLFWTAQDSVSCQVLDVANKMLFGFLKEGLNFWWHEGPKNVFVFFLNAFFSAQLHEICCSESSKQKDEAKFVDLLRGTKVSRQQLAYKRIAPLLIPPNSWGHMQMPSWLGIITIFLSQLHQRWSACMHKKDKTYKWHKVPDQNLICWKCEYAAANCCFKHFLIGNIQFWNADCWKTERRQRAQGYL